MTASQHEDVSPDSSATPSPAHDNSQEKLRLECEKLKAETRALERSVFKTVGFYAALSPVFLAALGLLFTHLSGWFEVQRTRIANEKTLLEAQRSELRMDIRDEEKKFAELKGKIESLTSSNAAQKAEIARLSAWFVS